jgi:Tfp pilus assembly protein PilW
MLGSNEAGLTIVEMLIAMIVGSLMTLVVTAFALNYWTSATVLQSDQGTLVSRLNAGDYLRGIIDSAAGLINQNDLPDANTLAPDPNNGNYWITIHAVPATYNIGSSGVITPLIYVERPSVDTSNNIVLNGSIPYHDDVIIYMNGTTKQLLSRIIANTSATNNKSRTTCPASKATTACPADAIIADNVTSVTMSYFSKSGNTINYQSIVDPNTGNYIGPDFPSVEVVQLNLQLYKSAQLHNGANTSNQTIIRVALRN